MVVNIEMGSVRLPAIMVVSRPIYRRTRVQIITLYYSHASSKGTVTTL